MNVFIDTQIWLSFYHYSTDDLESLRKLGVLMDQTKVRLHLPDQITEEFRRNREVKYMDAIKRFKEEKLNDSFPQLCRQYEAEYKQMEEAVTAYKDAKKKLLAQIDDHYKKEELRADEVIRELFAKGSSITATADVIAKAQMRYQKGNPPGKNDSLGDAINWECLLATMPPRGNLYFISDDKDYRSKLDDDIFEPFLKWEWKTKNGGDILFYRKLTEFFKKVFPEINLTEEVEKEELIREIAGSRSFASSHLILDKLAKILDIQHRPSECHSQGCYI
jgi:hypothetical protein